MRAFRKHRRASNAAGHQRPCLPSAHSLPRTTVVIQVTAQCSGACSGIQRGNVLAIRASSAEASIAITRACLMEALLRRPEGNTISDQGYHVPHPCTHRSIDPNGCAAKQQMLVHGACHTFLECQSIDLPSGLIEASLGPAQLSK